DVGLGETDASAGEAELGLRDAAVDRGFAQALLGLAVGSERAHDRDAAARLHDEAPQQAKEHRAAQRRVGVKGAVHVEDNGAEATAETKATRHGIMLTVASASDAAANHAIRGAGATGPKSRRRSARAIQRASASHATAASA